ncbi:MAG: phosphatase [Negativicutes bacterium]|nr:phosphatase [Negativicutes bacterium]
MLIVTDNHSHTVACGHAYGTIRENAEEAAHKGLKLLAITEHGPAHDQRGTPLMFFDTYRDVPDTIYGVRILKGCEANVIGMDGELDIPEKTLKKMDIVIASFHSSCTANGSVEENTARMIAAMKNPLVDIIGHPDRGYAIDVERVVLAAKQYNVAIEANDSSQAVAGDDTAQMKALLHHCRQHQVMLSLGSDAHSPYKIADLAIVSRMVVEAGIPEELILNTSVARLLAFLRSNHKTHL